MKIAKISAKFTDSTIVSPTNFIKNTNTKVMAIVPVFGVIAVYIITIAHPIIPQNITIVP